MGFMRTWFTGLVHPAKAMDSLKSRPGPFWGLRAVLIRFIGTSLFVALPLALLDRMPFQPSYLTFIGEQVYYRALVLFFPVFGLVTWLLMSSTGHLLLRLADQDADFDRLANVVGMSMLIPIPVILVWDFVMVVSGLYGLVTMAVSHVLFQIWETVLGVIGLRRVLGIESGISIAVAIAINLVYVMMGAFLSR